VQNGRVVRAHTDDTALLTKSGGWCGAFVVVAALGAAAIQ
jgi:hypothetical protein